MIRSRATVAPYPWGKGCEGWPLLAQSELSVIQERMPAGTAEVRHLHRTSRQLFFVLSGRLSIEHDGSELDLSPHDALEIPPGVAHCVRNPGPLEAHFLVISAPPSHDDRIEV